MVLWGILFGELLSHIQTPWSAHLAGHPLMQSDPPKPPHTWIVILAAGPSSFLNWADTFTIHATNGDTYEKFRITLILKMQRNKLLKLEGFGQIRERDPPTVYWVLPTWLQCQGCRLHAFLTTNKQVHLKSEPYFHMGIWWHKYGWEQKQKKVNKIKQMKISRHNCEQTPSYWNNQLASC